jgi:SWI/SNF-related matrix-associated actin-dependent regulator 1 of chromatin subfamily A
MTLELKPYQEAGAQFLATHKRAGLFDDMGLGKSAQTVRALDLKNYTRGMIVCPAAVRQHWVAELRKFSKINRRVIKASVTADFNAWARGLYDVAVVSYEMAAKWSKIVQADCIFMDFIILDESHFLKSGAAVRTQQILGPESAGDGMVKWADSVWYLTGTPMPNDPIDIHTFLYSSGATPYDRKTFVNEYFDRFPGTYSVAHQIKESKQKELKDLIAQHTVRRTLSMTGLDLPEIFITDTQIDGDSSAIKQLLLAHPGLDNIIVKVIESGGGLSGINMTVANHVATLRRLLGEAKAIPYAKMLVEEFNGGLDKIVVFGIHVQAIRLAMDYLRSHGIDCVSVTGDVPEVERVANVDRFQNDPKCKAFFGNIRAAGTGLTLTAANRLDMMESDFTPAGNAQAIKRVHRISQTRTVRARFITLANSFDEIVNQIVAEKTARIAAIDDVGEFYACK